MRGVDADAILRLAAERGGRVVAVNEEVLGVSKARGRGGRPRYKAPDETRRIDTEAMIRQYGRPKPERPVVWVEDVKDLMNGPEREFANLLDVRVAAGEVREWRFEPCSFRLGHACHYTPDFLVVLADGRVEFVEVKGGRIEEDALAKMKTFVAIYSFLPLLLARRGKKGFSIERVRYGGPAWRTTAARRAEAEADGEAVDGDHEEDDDE